MDRESPGANRCPVGGRAVRLASRSRSRRPRVRRSRHDPCGARVHVDPADPDRRGRAAFEARPQTGPIFAEHLGFDETTAEILEKSLPGGAQELRATGVIGVVLLVIAATSFARALERSLQTIWRTPTVSIKFAWRWLAALVAVVIGLALVVATRIIVRGDGPIPVIEFIAEVASGARCGGSHRGSSSIDASAFESSCPARCSPGSGSRWPDCSAEHSFRRSSRTRHVRFGVLGMAFTYIGWLLVLACILLIAVTVGRVVYLTYSGQAWRRS